MTKKLILILAALALATFALAACGGDDEDSGTDTATTLEEAPAEETNTDTTEAEDAGGKDEAAGPGGTVEIQADPDGGLSYPTGDVTTKSGEVTIEFDNPSSVPHDVKVEDSSGETIGGTEVIVNDSETVTLDLEPGEYVYYCSVGSHRQAGMEAALTVE